ncbi:MAG: aldehyde ferredoxin oxidoreductase family protein, partial [Promethearchaeota archaeon]
MKGWKGKILWIDLSSKNFTEERLDQEVYKQFIGGKGLGAFLLYRELKAGVDPLSPENIILFLSGPLQGLRGPSVARWTLVTKSPLTGLFLDTHCGEALGREIKESGYDAIGIRGKADKPTLLVVGDQEVKFLDADGLWGLGTIEATERIHDVTAQDAVVYTIGPAGENLVRIASGCCELAHWTGRGGAGAVMGSKNLKALTVKGTGLVEASSDSELRKLNKEAAKAWKEKDFLVGFKDYGTPFLVEVSNERGQFPTRNWESGFFEGYEALQPEMLQELDAGNQHSCPNCIMQCTYAFWTTDPRNPEAKVEATIEYETFGLLGGNLGISDANKVLQLSVLADDLGLDTIGVGGVIGFAMEAFQRDILTENDIGFPLNFGDGEAALRLMEMISSREGIGDILADGVRLASKKIARGSEEFAVHAKGMEFPAWDPRGKKGLGLSYGTAEVGASHLRGWPSTTEMPDSSAVELVESMVKARDEKHLVDSLVICHFTYHMPLELSQKIRLLNAATGLKYD